MLTGDTPTGPAVSNRKEQAAFFARVPAIGDRRDEGRPPAKEPEPVEDEAEVEASNEAEEYDEADDVEVEASQEPEELEDTSSDEEKEVFIVKVDGEEIEVDLDELQAGYSRQSDYTRKTQQLAAQRKEFEAERQQAQQLAQALNERLSEVENFLSQGTQEPDWAELSKQLDPREYNLARAQWDKQQQQLQAVMAQKQELQRLQQAEMQRQLEQAQARLPELIPDWRDAEKARSEAQAIRDYAIGVGFSEEALDSLVDPLAVKVLRDAWRFNELQRQKPTIRRKKSPKTAKAGAGVQKAKRKPEILKGPVKSRSEEAISFFQNVKTIK